MFILEEFHLKRVFSSHAEVFDDTAYQLSGLIDYTERARANGQQMLKTLKSQRQSFSKDAADKMIRENPQRDDTSKFDYRRRLLDKWMLDQQKDIENVTKSFEALHTCLCNARSTQTEAKTRIEKMMCHVLEE